MQTHTPTVVQEGGGWRTLPPPVPHPAFSLRYDILKSFTLIDRLLCGVQDDVNTMG